MLRKFEELTSMSETDAPACPAEGSVEPDNPVWVEFAESMAPMMAAMAPHLGRKVLSKGCPGRCVC